MSKLDGDLEVLVEPSVEEAVKALRRGFSQGRLLLVIGPCTVDYEGRARSTLSLGERVIICKPDGSFMVHRPTGYEPVNWNPPGALASVYVEDGSLKLVSIRKRPPEKLVVNLSRVYLVASLKLEDSGVFALHASEEEMRRAVLIKPELIEEGFKPMEAERAIDGLEGYADLVGEDVEGNLVVVEFKRVTAGREAVLQLKQYVDALSSRTSRRVRGILAAPSVTKEGLRLLEQLGFKFVRLDPQVCYQLIKSASVKPSTGLLDYL